MAVSDDAVAEQRAMQKTAVGRDARAGSVPNKWLGRAAAGDCRGCRGLVSNVAAGGGAARGNPGAASFCPRVSGPVERFHGGRVLGTFLQPP